MSSRLVVGLLGGMSCLLVPSLSHAQCSKDTDCKGERVCEAGACVAPSSPPAASSEPAAAAPAPPAPAPAPVAAPAPAANAALYQREPEPRSVEVRDLRRQRH